MYEISELQCSNIVNGTSQIAAQLSGQNVSLRPADFPRPQHNLWMTGDHFLSTVPAMDQPTWQTQVFHPTEVGK